MKAQRAAAVLFTCVCVSGPSTFGCSSAEDHGEATSRTTAAVLGSGAGPTITFSSTWTDTSSAPLVASSPVQVVYDAARLVPQCGGTATSAGANGGGGFAWEISGYFQMAGGSPVQFSGSNGSGSFTPPEAGDVQLWFTCGSTTGQTGVDSDYGQNYHFQVSASAQPTPTPDAGQTAARDAGHASDTGATTGTVTVQVVGDSVHGTAGTVPPDTIVGTPIAGVSVYDGAWEGNDLLGQTNANGELTVTLPLGAQQIGLMQVTTDDTMFSSDGNAVTVTTTPSTVVIHIIPNVVDIEATYDAGYGNALYITGETAALGNWQTAYKASLNGATWTYEARNILAGSQYKMILAPWVSGSSIPVSSAGVSWQTGQNLTVPGSAYAVVDITPSF